jgi:fructose-specific PTS system IIC-like component
MNELVQILKNTRQHLMTGVSHMIPFVVSGGILLAVSVMLYGKGAVPDGATDPNLKKLFDIGVAGLTLMVPFLAAYIGYSISDRAALAPAPLARGSATVLAPVFRRADRRDDRRPGGLLPEENPRPQSAALRDAHFCYPHYRHLYYGRDHDVGAG